MEKNTIESGRYLIFKQIGKGGNGLVYKAKDTRTGDIVALKRFKTQDVLNHKRLVEDLDKELRVLKYMAHPGLPKVFNIIKKENDFYLVMEYIEGDTLEKVIMDRKRLPKRDVISIAKQILSVMYYLHSQEPPVIYRDLKPENIIMQTSGRIKLIDFGNAKKYNRDISADARAYGTPKYAAPEQYGDREGRGIYNTDIRTDIYGAGAVLYYIATGYSLRDKLPFMAKIKYRFFYGKSFDRIIKRATKTYPRDRYQDDIDMLADVYAYMGKCK